MRKPFSFGDVALVVRSRPTGAGPLPLHATAVSWQTRATANGGSPAAGTVSALSTFCYALDAASLTSKMKAVNCFTQPDIACATTPLIVGPGVDPWTNINFGLSDLDDNGLKGNGSNKYLKTGINPSTTFSGVQGGVTLYITEGSDASGEQDIGCLTTSPGGEQQAFQVHSRFSGNAICDCFSDGAGRINQSNSGWLGYFSVNRRSTTDYKIYEAKSSVPHFQFASKATEAALGPPDRLITVFCGNYNGSGSTYGTIFSYSSKRLSFAALHDGLTAAESLALYNAVQALRTALGGGYV